MAGSLPALGPHTPQADVVAEAAYELARQQWRRLLSRFYAVTGRMVLLAVLAGLVATLVMLAK
jgi:hypothetical protein